MIQADVAQAIKDQANQDQTLAADPQASVWVAASAGTGKTTVLVNRLLRLFLNGTDPARVLCLTYTRAGAAEMANRIADTLQKWSLFSQAELSRALEELLGRPVEDEGITLARQLFARVLDAPGNLKIMTIHAFCQSVLKRFPLEAGVQPHFEIMEEHAAKQALNAAIQATLVKARSDSAGNLATALTILASEMAEGRFSDLITDLISHKKQFQLFLSSHADSKAATQAIYAYCGLDPDASEAAILSKVGTQTDSSFFFSLGQIVQTLAESSKSTDQNLAATLQKYIETNDFESLQSAFMTADGTPRAARYITKEIRDNHPQAAQFLDDLQQKVAKVCEQLNALIIARTTTAFMELGREILNHYTAYKQMRACLDYDDLILKTLSLLESRSQTAWVLYKLDGGIDHILVDEAQDTSAEQWEIIRRLTEDTFSGETKTFENKTLFVVGDVKQSIFSFQGANPDKFVEMREYFAEKIENAQKKWSEIPLYVSFRSSSVVLRAVDQVFKRSEMEKEVSYGEKYLDHAASRVGEGGVVEIWPEVIAPSKQKQEDPWPLPLKYVRDPSPAQILADQIADTIAEWRVEEQAGNQNAVLPGDIMILVRKRTSFNAHMVRALNKRGVPLSGIDRLKLNTQLVIWDLCAVLDFVLLPEDDLNLGCVLKSPLIGLNEEELLTLAYGRSGSLWQALADKKEHHAQFQKAYNTLSHFLGYADFLTPYQMIMEILQYQAGYKKLSRRLGRDVTEPVEEFLNLALQYERDAAPSLQGFLQWFRSTSNEVKRELSQTEGKIRILTVHGAKGLEAPVVFLVDDGSRPDFKQLDAFAWENASQEENRQENSMCWLPSQKRDIPATTTLKEDLLIARQAEHKRLLYVAMTRARDRLYICSYGKTAASVDSWYDLCRQALEPVTAPVVLDFGEGLRLQELSQVPAVPLGDPGTLQSEPVTPPPAWLQTAVEESVSGTQTLIPSQLDIEQTGVVSTSAQLYAIRRGTLIHRLLQVLPGIPLENQQAALNQFLQNQSDIEISERQSIAKEVINVLNHKDFSYIFGQNSKSEVAITQLQEKGVLVGQIDRLVFNENEVHIIDFKTNLDPPTRPNQVSKAYLAQMAAYRSVLREIYKSKKIKCFLLFTSAANLLEIGDDLLDTLSN